MFHVPNIMLYPKALSKSSSKLLLSGSPGLKLQTQYHDEHKVLTAMDRNCVALQVRVNYLSAIRSQYIVDYVLVIEICKELVHSVAIVTKT